MFENENLVYVGVTKYKLSRRMGGHKKFDKSIHTVSLLLATATREEAEAWETFAIKHFALREQGLNEAIGPGTTGVKQSPEWIDKKVTSRSWYESHSSQTIDKMRKAKKPKMMKTLCHENGVVYESRSAASRALGVNVGKISQIVNGKRKSSNGYTFSNVSD